jgi:hypothetical protein
MSIAQSLYRIVHSSTWQNLLALCTSLLTLGHGADIQAHTSGQGTSVRGGEVESVLPWGKEGLRGTLRLGDDSVPVQIIAFRGEEIDALVWNNELKTWAAVELHAGDLENLEWTEIRCAGASMCRVINYRIASARMDTSQSTMHGHGDDAMHGYGDNSDIWLYQVEYAVSENPPASEWRNVCDPVFGDDRGGIFVDGHDKGDGTWNPGGYTFSCTSGVIAKCAREWGYKPWKTLMTDSGQAVALEPLHRACVRAARADYCGNGQSSTRDGTRIDMVDIYGFNRRITGTGMHREATFSPDGAVSIARTRWPLGAGGPGSGPTPVPGPWIDLPACRLPRHVPGSRRTQALIEVWSHHQLHDDALEPR